MTDPLVVLPNEYVGALSACNLPLKDSVQLITLGEHKLRKLLVALRATEKTLNREIGHVKRKLEVFDGKTRADFVKEADYAIDVALLGSHIVSDRGDTLGDTWYEFGPTTFKTCGGCEHNHDLGDQMVCGISYGFGEVEPVTPASQCSFRTRNRKAYLAALTIRANRKISTLQTDRAIVQKEIGVMRTLLRDEKPKNYPPLPCKISSGPRTRFAFGDRVYVYTFMPACRKKDRRKWRRATVIYQDGIHSCVCFDEPIMTAHMPRKTEVAKRITNPRYVWIGHLDQYTILHAWEWDILQKAKTFDQDFFRDWEGAYNDKNYHAQDSVTGITVEMHGAHMIKQLRDHDLLPDRGLVWKTHDTVMGVWEAMTGLGFTEEPTDPEQVIVAYRQRLNKLIPHDALERAKDTLLLRIYGVRSLD